MAQPRLNAPVPGTSHALVCELPVMTGTGAQELRMQSAPTELRSIHADSRRIAAINNAIVGFGILAASLLVPSAYGLPDSSVAEAWSVFKPELIGGAVANALVEVAVWPLRAPGAILAAAVFLLPQLARLLVGPRHRKLVLAALVCGVTNLSGLIVLAHAPMWPQGLMVDVFAGIAGASLLLLFMECVMGGFEANDDAYN